MRLKKNFKERIDAIFDFGKKEIIIKAKNDETSLAQFSYYVANIFRSNNDKEQYKMCCRNKISKHKAKKMTGTYSNDELNIVINNLSKEKKKEYIESLIV